MNLSSLEIFCVVADEQSVTRAAARLERVQSNVTTRIKQLESDLNVLLFSRDGKRMTLTSDGHRLLEYARRMLLLAEEARQAMLGDSPSGRLRIGTTESAIASRLPSLLSSFHAKWPDIRVEILVGTSDELVRKVVEGTLDGAFASIVDRDRRRVLKLGEGLHSTRVCTEDLMLVLPPSHAPVQRPVDLTVDTMAVFPMGCTYRTVLEEWLSGSEEERERWHIVEQVSYHAILACVAAGSCFALCPRSVLDQSHGPVDFRTHFVLSIDTLLLSRISHNNSALDALGQLLRPRHLVSVR
jgi:DNA-binding transcriptional LysR family regulator